MAKHPTPSELKEQAKKNLEAFDPDLASPSKSVSPTPSPTPSSTHSASPSQSMSPSVSPSPSPSPSAPPDDDTPPPAKKEEKKEEEGTDWKKRYADSSREAKVLAANNKGLRSAVAEAEALPEPTDEEMEAEYSSWGEMSDTERRLAKDNILNKRRFMLIADASNKGKDLEDWLEKVDTFVEDPKVLADNPALDGREEEFKIFATKDTRRGVDLQDLADAFLHTMDKNKPAPKKGAMFPTGGGGEPARDRNDGKMTTEQASELKKRDFRGYVKALKAGKIKIEA